MGLSATLEAAHSSQTGLEWGTRLSIFGLPNDYLITGR